MTATPPVGDTSAENVGHLLEGLQRFVIMIGLRFHCWTGQSVIEEARVVTTVDQDGVPTEQEVPADRRTSSRWKMMPSTWQKRFSGLKTKYRKLIQESAVRFPVHGVHVVPLSLANQTFGKLNQLRTEMEELSSEFVQEYSQIRLAFRQDVGEQQWNLSARKWPDATDMQRRFGVHWFMLPLSIGDTSESSFDRLADDVAENYIQAAQEQLRTMVNEVITTIIAQPREEMAEAVKHLAESLRQDRTIKTSTIDAVRATLSKLEAFNFLGDNELKDLIRGVRGQIGGQTSSDLNNMDRQAAENLSTVLSGFVSEAENVQRHAAAQQFFNRRILRD